MGAAESSMFNSLEKNSNCKFMTLQLRLSPAFFVPSAQVFITDGIILSLRTGAYEVEEEVHEA